MNELSSRKKVFVMLAGLAILLIGAIVAVNPRWLQYGMHAGPCTRALSDDPDSVHVLINSNEDSGGGWETLNIELFVKGTGEATYRVTRNGVEEKPAEPYPQTISSENIRKALTYYDDVLAIEARDGKLPKADVVSNHAANKTYDIKCGAYQRVIQTKFGLEDMSRILLANAGFY